MKTILVPMENRDTMQSALETAVLLAQQNDSHIEGFALRCQINLAARVDLMSGIPLERYAHNIEKDATNARQIFESFMQNHNVPQSSQVTGALSFGWLDEAPNGDTFVGSYGRVFDVIVMNRPVANSTGLYKRAIESGLFESGRPILLSPPSSPRQIATNILIAWNCSTEQARATALAIPLLQKADRVTVLTVIGGTAVPGPPAEQLIRYLRCNGLQRSR
jgi:hypothetical protein